MDVPDLAAKCRPADALRGRVALVAIYPEIPGLNLSARTSLACDEQPEIPVAKPNPGQHVLEPDQRVHSVVVVRSADDVGLRQRNESQGRVERITGLLGGDGCRFFLLGDVSLLCRPSLVYVVYRWLHWRPLYRLAHELHHRNVDVGPWSGIAMHPVEHVIYFSGFFIWWIVPADPIIVILTAFSTASVRLSLTQASIS